MKLIAVLSVSALALAAQTEGSALESVRAVRHWSTPEATRVAIEVSGDFTFRTDRLHNPERVYFDIMNARPRIRGRRLYSEQLTDKLVTRIRVAETSPGITRVVLDLAGPVETTTSQLANPDRLIVELRQASPVTARPDTPPVVQPPAAPPAVDTPPAAIAAEPPATAPLKPEPAKTPSILLKPTLKIPVRAEAEKPRPELPEAPKVSAPAPAAPPPTTAGLPAGIGKAARHTSSGDTSLVRALGLKVARVVIDPGHGGHDQGTEGPKGLLEKDLVLDVSKRLGKLITDRLGAEVIYTRSDDTFIPLEGRTALANEKKADLFISIHANSSPLSRTTGVETYYLNFTESKEALDVAARENASSQKSVFELRELIQKITLHEKIEESKELASKVQTALYAFSARSVPHSRNRGVKKAPFVVLIGANMPSILAEIGFLSNPREEALLKKSDYREKLTEALFRGISRYTENLSHFQVAQAGN
jgi:N-acetylmuramoyl-L-alanine amidase